MPSPCLAVVSNGWSDHVLGMSCSWYMVVGLHAKRKGFPKLKRVPPCHWDIEFLLVPYCFSPPSSCPSCSSWRDKRLLAQSLG